MLYYGSFAALARQQEGFDWREEAWETLTHELRHHLEWRARAPALEAFDRAVEQNFARQDGEAFDPLFYLDGEPAGEAAYRVEDDVFLDRIVAEAPSAATVQWRGRSYRVDVPADDGSPGFPHARRRRRSAARRVGARAAPEAWASRPAAGAPALAGHRRAAVEVYFSRDSADFPNS